MEQRRESSIRRMPIGVWFGAPAALLTLLAIFAIVGISAIDRAWVRGPDLDFNLGNYRLIASTSNRPECLPIPPQQCFISFPTAATARPQVYAVWVGRIEQIPGLGEPVTISTGRYVLYRPIGKR